MQLASFDIRCKCYRCLILASLLTFIHPKPPHHDLVVTPPRVTPTQLPVIHALSLPRIMLTIAAASSTYAGLPPSSFAASSTSSESTPYLRANNGALLSRGNTTRDISLGIQSYSPVPAMHPTDTELIVALSASSRIHTRVIAQSAPLLPAYAVEYIKPTEASILEILTSRPDRSVGRYGIAADTRNAGPLALILNAPSYASAVRPSRASGFVTLALLTIM